MPEDGIEQKPGHSALRLMKKVLERGRVEIIGSFREIQYLFVRPIQKKILEPIRHWNPKSLFGPVDNLGRQNGPDGFFEEIFQRFIFVFERLRDPHSEIHKFLI